MKYVAQLWAPLLYNPQKQQQQQFSQMQVPQPQQELNHQQTIGAAATPLMEGEASWNAAPMEGGALWNDQRMMGVAAAPMEEAFDNFVPFGEATHRFASASGSGYYQHEQGISNDVPAEPWMMNKNLF
uniref:Uncharacterized protein n=1 Tax=Leersia perrieri TaxID=77586 RepID=A0A0D9WQ42_9ORYZ